VISPEKRFGIGSVSVNRVFGAGEKSFTFFDLPEKFGNSPLFS